MRIGLKDIDPRIADLVRDRLCAPINEFLREDVYWGGLPVRLSWQFHTGGLSMKKKREATPDEKAAYQRRKRSDSTVIGRAMSAAIAPLFTFMPMLLAISASQTVLRTVVWLMYVGSTWGMAWWARSGSEHIRIARNVEPDEMRAVFPLLSLSPAERSYCDTLVLMARMDAPPEVESQVRDTLNQLAGLVASSRELERKRQSLLPILGSNSVSQLEYDASQLEARLSAATDPLIKQSISQSLDMCRSRVDNARAFEHGLERLKDQEETIVHTLGSAQTALARLQLSPSAAPDALANAITDTVTQMTQQTRSVEKAVEEVMNVRLGG